jgi:hypothetical protein
VEKNRRKSAVNAITSFLFEFTSVRFYLVPYAVSRDGKRGRIAEKPTFCHKKVVRCNNSRFAACPAQEH